MISRKMKLIKYENYQVVPADELFLLKDFRTLFNKDKSKNKEKFMEILSVIYFCYDPRSTYADIFDDDERLKEVKKQEGLDDSFEITPEIQKAIDTYRQVTTTTSQKLLDSMRKSIAKIGEFLENVNLYATDDKGKQVYNVSQIVQATDKIPQLAKKLIETEKIVNAEIAEQGRIRGGEEQAHAYEAGF